MLCNPINMVAKHSLVTALDHYESLVGLLFKTSCTYNAQICQEHNVFIRHFINQVSSAI